jgi:hypothetical protein
MILILFVFIPLQFLFVLVCSDIPLHALKFCPFDQLSSALAEATEKQQECVATGEFFNIDQYSVDVIGIVIQAEPINEITTKKGQKQTNEYTTALSRYNAIHMSLFLPLFNVLYVSLF